MDSSVTARRVLAKAAVQAGGIARLAERMGVGAKILREYITGVRPVPDALFLAAIDVVLEELPDPGRPARTDAPVQERGPLLDP